MPSQTQGEPHAPAAADATSLLDTVLAQPQPRTYVTAQPIQIKRDLNVVRAEIMKEAEMAGDACYYGWGKGKDRVEGASIKLAEIVARCWGNCTIDMEPVQETADAWIFTAIFIDLETGYSLFRQFRQSKRSIVYGKHDEERKADIRFQNGQSRATRNVITNALPAWLVDAAIEVAKKGVRKRIEVKVEKNGLPAAIDGTMTALLKEGVKEEHVLAKYAVAKRQAFTLDHIVQLCGDLKAIQNGVEWAESLFPDPNTPADADAALERAAAPEDNPAGHDPTPQPEAPPEAGQDEPEPPFDPPTEDETDAADARVQRLGEFGDLIADLASDDDKPALDTKIKYDALLTPQQIAILRQKLAAK